MFLLVTTVIDRFTTSIAMELNVFDDRQLIFRSKHLFAEGVLGILRYVYSVLFQQGITSRIAPNHNSLRTEAVLFPNLPKSWGGSQSNWTYHIVHPIQDSTPRVCHLFHDQAQIDA